MEAKLGSILCATDFSKFSKPVVDYAARLALRFSAHLIIFHAVCYPRNPLHGTAVSRRPGEPDGPAEHAQKQIKKLMEGCPVSWEPVIKYGDPVDEIIKFAPDRNVSLVVAASYGLSGWKRILLGTVVEQLARALTRPLLVVRSGNEPDAGDAETETPLKNILICCDLAEPSDPLFGYALKFAHQFGSRMHFIHTVAAPLDTEIVDPTAGPYEEVQQTLQDQLLERLVGSLPEKLRTMPDVITAVIPGIAGEKLTAYALENDVDLIIVGVRPRTTFKKLLIGSTTETLLRQAPCEVLTVPPVDETAAVSGQKDIDHKDRKTGIVRDPRYLNHLTADGHPESRQRLEAIYRMLDGADMSDRFTEIPPRKAETDELLLVHTPEHLSKITATQEREHYALTPDTHTSPGSFEAASLAVGGIIEAVSMVATGQLSNAFALVRPPGHHAEKSRAMGYCLFNNVALAAMYARKVLGMSRILIVDWDVHHGNGTQHIFEQDDTVLFFSIHQYPHFPGTGVYTEAGIGQGEGFTVNVPISKRYGDGEYVAIFEFLLRPLALEFHPELIIVSAGFDIHTSDPLGSMRVTARGFAGLTRSLMETAKACCDGKLVFALEGGYNRKTIGDTLRAVLNELSGTTCCDISKIVAQAKRKKLAYALKRSVKVHRQYWKCLSEPYEVKCSGYKIRV